ncbi:MAG: hypothetical protein Q9210_005520 [Variospora velana]
METSLAGKVAIVTGAGSGINLAFARLLLQSQCNVLFADLALRPEAKEVVEAHSSSSRSSARAVFQETDVREWPQLERMFTVASNEFGEVDIVCPGAGVYEPPFSSFWHPPGASPVARDLPNSSRYASLDINLLHPIRTTQLAIAHFLSRQAPSSSASHAPTYNIIHVSSIAAQASPLLAPLYNASKHGLSGFVRTLAPLDNPTHRIRVTAVAPGVIDTPLWRDNPEKLRLVDDSKEGGDEWVSAEEVADVMGSLVDGREEVEVVSSTERRSDGREGVRKVKVEGGLILEVSKSRVRKVEQFNDEGPKGAGNTSTEAYSYIKDATARCRRASLSHLVWTSEARHNMVFTSPPEVPKLPFDPPDSIPICDFMLDERYGRRALNSSRPPFTCGLTGIEYSAVEVKYRVDRLARALSKQLGWQPNEGTEWDKVAGVFSVNSIHRLSGISSPANAAYSLTELEHQLRSSGSKALFTCQSLLSTALEAASRCNIPKRRIYLLDVPKEFAGGQSPPKQFRTISQLIQEGASLPALEKLRWDEGQGARQTAFLCYSSGTSGLPKGVMISHRNVIANTLQICTYEAPHRERLRKPGEKDSPTEVALGLLPQSHIYGLVVICHATIYRGDQVVNLPKFEIRSFLNAIQRFKINKLFLVPPIVIGMLKNKPLCDEYDLSSVVGIFTGAAPLGKETAEELQKQYPTWQIRQGYGLTETCTVVCSTAPDDIWFGSSGCFLPMVEARIMNPEGNEIMEYDTPGELVVKSPSVVLGYLNNEEANKDTFQDGWMWTGDVAVIRKSPRESEHCFIVDRIKELIKVKGMQVAPAELEAHLLTHPAVADCAVIPVPDDAAGELPKAFVVKSSSVGIEDSDRMLVRDIQKHVESHKARHKWLKGGVTFISEIPKSASGKILRRMLKDKDKELRRQQGPKL